jgi:ribonuclease HII
MKIADLTPEQLQMWGRGEGIADFGADPEETERLRAISVYEEELWSNAEYIAGIDEVGRGPIAGPVVAAAVILPKHCLLPGINDSKKLSAKKRYALEPLIRQASVAWALGAVGAHEIDRYNILEATKMAMLRAVASLPIQPQHLLLDAVHLTSPIPQTSLIKGDAKSISIGAASILAKCHRYRMMEIYDEMYSGYGLAKHAGYPTKAHKEAVFALGYSPIHRKSFVLKPIKK